MAGLKPLNHWMLQDDRLAREFDGVLNLSPYYDPVRLDGIRSEISFFASLTGDVNSPVGQIAGNFQRNSNATYRAALGFYLQSAGDDVSRHEYSQDGEALGLLMEPATTNVCQNYNADPDEALTGITASGPGSVSREYMANLLAQSGLDRLCKSGYVIKADGTLGQTDVLVSGFAPNVNGTHGLKAYVYCPQGGGFIAISGGGGTAIPFSENEKFELVSGVNTLSGLGGTFFLRVEPGSIAYFVLNHLEEADVPSSVIINEGAATSRAVDQLSWPLTEEILNQAEGMVAMEWRPHFGDTNINLDTQTVLLNTIDSGSIFLYFRKLSGAGENRFQSFDGAATSYVNIASKLAANQLYLVAMRWTASIMQIGFKSGGAWVWGTEVAHQPWLTGSNLFLLPLAGSTAPLNSHSKNLYLWAQDEGTAWLEGFFSGVAN